MTLTPNDHVVVVGAGLAGWRLIENLRREGFDGSLTLIGEEGHAPYDRPPLSKQVLTGKLSSSATSLASPDLLNQARVKTHLADRAVALDLETRSVTLASGTQVTGSHVALATGTRARTLPFSASNYLHTIRTRDDLDRLLKEVETLRDGEVVAIIGGGFIGAEAATSLASRGLVPVVLEVAARPLINALGPTASAWLEDLAAVYGVELRTHQSIQDVTGSPGDLVVHFDTGETLAARCVIVGAGAVPNTEWLESSGLRVDNGVVVDAELQAAPDVAALGDVARFVWHGTLGESLVRMEHWQVANDHASQLAHYWMTGDSSTAMVPYFWSDQYGKKIQMLGHPAPSDEIEVVGGSISEHKWVALYHSEGIVTGVLALSQPRALMLSKVLLDERTTLEEAHRRAPWSS
jgi:NADPH-dependent 2,4-dienoyl-CoA reductase/sulfur reductase-like enzyme